MRTMKNLFRVNLTEPPSIECLFVVWEEKDRIVFFRDGERVSEIKDSSTTLWCDSLREAQEYADEWTKGAK